MIPEYPIIFLHLPKTAGTSLRLTIQKNYRARDLYFVYSRHPQFHSIEEFRAFAPEDFRKYRIIMGHFPFNKRLLPFEDRRFVTIVREPVQRCISYYRHVMGRDEWQGREVDLPEYLRTSGDIQLQNHQVRLLSGMKRDPITDEHLERAKQNIERYFLYTGVAESFSETVNDLADILGWGNRNIFQENVSVKDRPVINNVSEEALERIKALNELDIELYEWVSNRLKKQ